MMTDITLTKELKVALLKALQSGFLSGAFIETLYKQSYKSGMSTEEQTKEFNSLLVSLFPTQCMNSICAGACLYRIHQTQKRHKKLSIWTPELTDEYNKAKAHSDNGNIIALTDAEKRQLDSFMIENKLNYLPRTLTKNEMRELWEQLEGEV